jgi:uncharacterized DUF497 family protein
MGLRFEWDRRKAARNLAKHGLSFDEASTVFADRLSLTIPDPDHSEDEDRWIIIGQSNRGRLLVVVHTRMRTQYGSSAHEKPRSTSG